MIGTTSCPPATARAPPGMKSFWTSTTSRISRSPGVISVMLLCAREQALHQSAHLERARLAPRSPEVQDDQLVRVVGKRGRPPVERCEPERRPVLTLGELVDAGLLERVERRGRVSRMMAALLTWPPERQRPEEAAEQEDGEACPHERLIPADAEETRPPASHVSPDSPAAPSRRPRTRSVLSP